MTILDLVIGQTRELPMMNLRQLTQHLYSNSDGGTDRRGGEACTPEGTCEDRIHSVDSRNPRLVRGLRHAAVRKGRVQLSLTTPLAVPSGLAVARQEDDLEPPVHATRLPPTRPSANPT